eukprot:scaffold21750_cov128-Isochrysis_galbana.AAC.10
MASPADARGLAPPQTSATSTSRRPSPGPGSWHHTICAIGRARTAGSRQTKVTRTRRCWSARIRITLYVANGERKRV